jgi:hypothetical protein
MKLRSDNKLITFYDPNIRWSDHQFEITYMMWDYSLTVTTNPIGGNCRGFNLFSVAIEQHSDQLYGEQGKFPKIFLKKPAEDGDGEDSLECCPDFDQQIQDWLNSMCVSVRLISHEPEMKGGAV